MIGKGKRWRIKRNSCALPVARLLFFRFFFRAEISVKFEIISPGYGGSLARELEPERLGPVPQNARRESDILAVRDAK